MPVHERIHSTFTNHNTDLFTPLHNFVSNDTMLQDATAFQEISLLDARLVVENFTNTTHLGRDEALAKVEIIVLSIILALAITGNSCVLTALARRGKAGSRMHLFIFHLSIADLLVAIFNILPQLIWDITETFYGGDALCRYIKFMQIYVMYLSTYMLVMTAIDRYRAVCHPLSAFNTSSRTTLYVMIFAAYFISGILSLPQPIIFKYQQPDIGSGEYDCWVKFDPPWTLNLYITSFTFAIYIVPLIILTFSYVSICRTIWKKHNTAKNEREINSNGSASSFTNRNVYSYHVANKVVFRKRGVIERRPNIIRRNVPPVSSTPRSHTLRGFSRAKMKTVKLTFVVILAYLICWSPFFVSQLWWLYDESQGSNAAVVIMVLLASLNSCCNPWIYLAFSGNLIRHVCPKEYRRGKRCSCCSFRLCPHRQHHYHHHHHPHHHLHFRNRRRSSSSENNPEANSQQSEARDIKGRDVRDPNLELRELIVNDVNRTRETYKNSSPDTAGFTITSKTLVTKTGSPKVSQRACRKNCLYKMAVLQNGRSARDMK